MSAWLDLLLTTLPVVAAGAYVVRHLAARHGAPRSCAPPGPVQPKVIVGAALAQALAKPR
jgi:hypothetical protein